MANSSNDQVNVFVRCRPLLKSELNVPVYESVEVHPDLNKIIVRGVGTDKCTVKTFSFDKVFDPEAKQADVYAQLAPIVQEVIMGYNCTIFAYGQTGTGKTFTIEGRRTPNLKDRTKDPLAGIIPRAMQDFFKTLADKETESEIYVSFLELYNEEIYDLLSNSDDLVKLKMFDKPSHKGSVIVKGMKIKSVSSMDDVYALLDTGCKKRRNESTLLNEVSSRSHAIFSVTVKVKESSLSVKSIRSGKLNLVDLAGSENIGRSGAIDKRAREAGSINQSLLALGRVITSLCEKSVHIPYRESKLTRLLQVSLGGRSKTTFIANISPCAVNIEETLNTLEYALRARSITNKPEIKLEVTSTMLTKDYLEEITRLKEAIYNLGDTKGFYVTQETLSHWDFSLASKQEDKFNLIRQIEALTEESKSLDAAILQENDLLKERGGKLNEILENNNKMTAELQNERESSQLRKEMLFVMQSTSDNLHEDLHEWLEERSSLQSEVMKGTEKVNAVVEEQNYILDKIHHLQTNRRQTIEQFRHRVDELTRQVNSMHDHGKSLAEECNIIITSLRNGFESICNMCENEFMNFFATVKNLEAANNVFLENSDSTLKELKSSKMKWMNEFEAAHKTLNITILDPLNKAMDDCERSLCIVSSAFNDWNDDLKSKAKLRQKLLKEHVDNHKDAMESTTECVNALLSELKESLDNYKNIVSESVKAQVNNKKMWDDCFFTVDRAILSLDIFCTELIKNESVKTTQAQSFLKSYSKKGRDIADKLVAYCESSCTSADAIQKEVDILAKDAFPAKWEKMKESMDFSCAKYNEASSEVAKCSNTKLNLPGYSNDTQDAAIEFQPKVAQCIQDICDCFSKFGENFQTVQSENKRKVDTYLSREKISAEELNNISGKLLACLASEVTAYNQCWETDILNPFIQGGYPKASDDARYDSYEVTGEKTQIDQDTTVTLSENVDTWHETECPVCQNKGADKTLREDESDFFSKNEIFSMEPSEATCGESSCSATDLSRSPIRSFQRNAFIASKNTSRYESLKFLDFEKLSP